MSSSLNSSRKIFTRGVTKRNNSASKIQSIFKGYNTRKLTNNIKKNSRKYLQGLSKKHERRIKVSNILQRMFDKTHQASHGRDYDASEEVKLIMTNLGRFESRTIPEHDIAQTHLYETKIRSLVKKIQIKLYGFIGTTEQKMAKVHNELEELRYLFYIPFFKASNWSYSDQKWRRSIGDRIEDRWDEGTLDGKKYYRFFHTGKARLLHEDIAKELATELPTLFPQKRPNFPDWDDSYMRRAGGKKNTYKRKFHKTSF
jgi:hypothetical protein